MNENKKFVTVPNNLLSTIFKLQITDQESITTESPLQKKKYFLKVLKAVNDNVIIKIKY